MDVSRDRTAEYAVSLARAFDAHVTGIGFAYDVFVPGFIFSSIPVELASAERAKNEKAARAAIAAFEEVARGARVSAASYVLSLSLADSADNFGKLARRFDLAVVGQAEPDKTARNLIIEAALFESGRPLLIVPYIQREGLELDCVMVCWDGAGSDDIQSDITPAQVTMILVRRTSRSRHPIARASCCPVG